MKTATKELSEGDRVFCRPRQEEGVIVMGAGNKAQWFVTLATGKTWIYHSEDLELVES